MSMNMNETLFRIGSSSFTIGSVIGVLFVLFVVFAILRISRFAFDRRARTNPDQRSRLLSAYQLLKYAVWIVAIAIALKILDVDLTFLIAGSAALLVGLGLGMQSTFNDIVSGIILLIEGSVRVGDVLEVDGLVGRVTEINLRTSTIFSRDGMNVIVPNHNFINENVVNWSHNAVETRFHITVGVAYGSDENVVKDILMACAMAHPMVIVDDKEHPVVVRLADFGDSALMYELFFWSQRIFRIENVKSDIRFAILRKFREAGVMIPFPQRDVHLVPTAPNA